MTRSVATRKGISARLGKIIVVLMECACGARPPVARPRNAPDPSLLLRSNAQNLLLSYEHLLIKMSEGKMKVQGAHDNVKQTTDA